MECPKIYTSKREKHIATVRRYRSKPKAKFIKKQEQARRTARKWGATIEYMNYKDMFDASDKKCFYCRCSVSIENVQFDHYIPFKRGGHHVKSNIRISCSYCNTKKKSRLPEVFCALMGYTNV